MENEFYGISAGNDLWVAARGLNYSCLGNVPSLFTDYKTAEMVVESYQDISAASGKPARTLGIVLLKVVAE